MHKLEDSLYNLGIKKELKSLIEPKKIENENKKDEINEKEEKKEVDVIKPEDNNSHIIYKEILNNDNDIKKSNNNEEEDIEKEEEKEESKSEDEKVEKIEENNITKEEIDENLDIIFLTLCKLHLQNEKFPMDPGKLYHDFMKPLSEEIHKNINIKLSI